MLMLLHVALLGGGTYADAVARTRAATGFAPGAPRYWPKYGGSHEVTVLDGTWDFGFIEGWDSGFDSMVRAFTPNNSVTPNKTTVPSCMDVVAGGAPGYLGPRGVGLFRTSLPTRPPGVPLRLQFQSCSFYCRVWVNGKEIGEHLAGGYVAFSLDVPAALLKPQGDNVLFVLADNRFNATTAPMHTGGDFWHYGGITRSVELHTLSADAAVLWRAYVTPSASDVTDPAQPSGAPETVDITLALSSPEDGPVQFSMAFDDAVAVPMNGTARLGRIVLSGVKVPDPKPWAPGEPNMHTLTVTLRGGSVTERFGLRRFGVDKASSRVTINGKVTKLVGWNHHTQWPVTAASPTDAQLDEDIALLTKGHANFVRGAHYPHDPRMIDRLDEAGILFWSETLGPGVSVDNTKDWAFFMRYQEQQLNEMLDNALNHASIFAWGWFNEGPSNMPDACPAYAACNRWVRARDTTRFTTWADDMKLRGACFEHASLISLNDYPGWYDLQKEGIKAPLAWNTFALAVTEGTTRSGKHTVGKPMVISETGAGGVYEWSANATAAKWTLKYQSEIVGGDVDVALSNENISGICLWHFYDFKVDNCGTKWPCNRGPGQENGTHCTYDHPPPTTFAELASKGPPNCTHVKIDGRPAGENHKGSLDFWRREKPAFRLVADKYKNANMQLSK